MFFLPRQQDLKALISEHLKACLIELTDLFILFSARAYLVRFLTVKSTYLTLNLTLCDELPIFGTYLKVCQKFNSSLQQQAPQLGQLAFWGKGQFITLLYLREGRTNA